MSKHPILSNLLAMAVLSVLIVFLLILVTNIYTSHGEERLVPDLKGLSREAAEAKLREQDLKCEVVDSVYLSGRTFSPGAVVETIPEANSKVKPGRIIFLTVNAFSPQRGTIPDLKDLSLRQATAILRAVGFRNISQRFVGGDFVDLVSSVETSTGEPIKAGDRLPLSETLVLVVIRGGVSLMPDSLLAPDSLSRTVETEGQGPMNDPEADPQSENESWW